MATRASRRRRNGAKTHGVDSTPRFIGYTRVSKPGQADNGISLMAQAERLRAWATAYGYELVTIEQDAGISGTVSPERRPGMRAALDAIRTGKADGLVAVKMDRFSRSVRDTLRLAETFDRKGWLLASVGEQFDTSTASGRLFLNLLASMAAWERDVISERTTAALAQLAREGRPRSGRTPFGYCTDSGGFVVRSGDGALQEDPGEQKLLRRMLALREQGCGPQAIARELNAEKTHNRSGADWTRQNVWAVLDSYDAREEVRRES